MNIIVWHLFNDKNIKFHVYICTYILRNKEGIYVVMMRKSCKKNKDIK